MKKWVLIFVVFGLNDCLAQTKSDILNYNSYYSILPQKKIAEIRLTKDSLFLTWTRMGRIEKNEHYKIISQETKNRYLLIYTQIKNPRIRLNSLSAIFHVFVFHLSNDDDAKLYVLHEYTSYTSVEDAKKAFDTIKLNHKYFTNWYSKKRFNEITGYPDLSTANPDTIQRIIYNWVAKAARNSDKVRNTQTGDMYGVGYTQDNLTKELVARHFNPLFDLNELEKLRVKYHLVIPAPRSKASSNPKVGASHPSIIIDGPVGNN